MRLLAGLTFQNCPRVVAYALIAAVVAAGVLAADGAYRWYRDAGVQVAEPSAPEPAVSEAPVRAETAEAPEPATAGTRHADTPPHTQGAAAEPGTVGVAQQPERQPEKAPARNTAAGSIPIPAPRPATGTATARAPQEAATPQRAEPKSSPQARPQQARRSPTREDTRERAAPRPPVQAATRPPAPAANPNVYYERDSQLGYAPQLRARTCNPATGQMPMQCYYPREGREQFPAKPLD